MKRTYKLNPEAFEAKAKAIFKRGALILSIAASAGLLIWAVKNGFDLLVLSIAIPTLSLAGYIGLRRGVRLQKESWDSFQIVWDGSEIRKSQIRTKDVVFHKNEISKIEESKDGVILKSENSLEPFFLPKELDGFAELVAELKSLISLKNRG